MYIALDVGATNMRVAVFENLEKPKIKKVVKLPTLNDYRKDLANIISTINELKGNEKIKGIGMGVAGSVDKKKGAVSIAANLRGWIGKPLKKDLEKALGTQFYIENDTSCAALGEAIYGSGKGKEFIFIIWGTGIGGAHVFNSKGHIHCINFEPEFQIIDWQGSKKTFGFNSISGAGIEKKYGKKSVSLNNKEWQCVEKDFARALYNISTIRISDLFIVGGGVGINQPKRIKNISDILEREFKSYFPIPKVKLTKFGDDAGLIGALALIKTNS